jgi:hypothetical protein
MRQLGPGEQVTLIKAENGWAYIAKGVSHLVMSKKIIFSNSKNSRNGIRPPAAKLTLRRSELIFDREV